MRTRANIFTLTGHQSTVADVKTQDSDPQIISGSMDSTVRYDRFTGQGNVAADELDYGILLRASA
jgi:hypothetical protein